MMEYTVKEAKETVKNIIKGYLRKEDGRFVMAEVNRLPIYLEGAPGMGKTEIVSQISDEMNLGLVSFSLVHHTRNSLLGLPVIEELKDGEKYTNYTMSEIIAKVKQSVEEGHEEGILLLDEFPCMSESIMPAMLAFLQTKNIGMHHLPEGWVIVLCGNPPEYNKSARSFDTAILDRIRVMKIRSDAQVFLDYGKKIGLHETILNYLTLRPEHVYVCNHENGKKELVTCRGWENVSHAIKAYESIDASVDVKLVLQCMKSEAIAKDFWNYYKQCMVGISMEDMEEILDGVRFMVHKEQVAALSVKQQWILMEYICDLMMTREIPSESEQNKMVSEWMNHVIDLFEEADEKGLLSEKFYEQINKSKQLLQVVAKVRTEKYVMLNERFLAGICNKKAS